MVLFKNKKKLSLTFLQVNSLFLTKLTNLFIINDGYSIYCNFYKNNLTSLFIFLKKVN
jgi:hypothetical protein